MKAGPHSAASSVSDSRGRGPGFDILSATHTLGQLPVTGEKFLSRLPQVWRHIGIRFSIRLSVCTSVNICDHPSFDPTVQVHNSETL